MRERGRGADTQSKREREDRDEKRACTSVAQDPVLNPGPAIVGFRPDTPPSRASRPVPLRFPRGTVRVAAEAFER